MLPYDLHMDDTLPGPRPRRRGVPYHATIAAIGGELDRGMDDLDWIEVKLAPVDDPMRVARVSFGIQNGMPMVWLHHPDAKGEMLAIAMVPDGTDALPAHFALSSDSPMCVSDEAGTIAKKYVPAARIALESMPWG